MVILKVLPLSQPVCLAVVYFIIFKVLAEITE